MGFTAPARLSESARERRGWNRSGDWKAPVPGRMPHPMSAMNVIELFESDPEPPLDEVALAIARDADARLDLDAQRAGLDDLAAPAAGEGLDAPPPAGSSRAAGRLRL